MRDGLRVSEVLTASVRLQYAMAAAALSSDVVLAVGPTSLQSAELAARRSPRTQFLVVADGVPQAPNVHVRHVMATEGDYLAGAAAALATPYDVFGVVRGTDLPEERARAAAFVAGAQSVRAVQVRVRYLSRAPDLAGLRDRTGQAALARSLALQGVRLLVGPEVLPVPHDVAGLVGPPVWAVTTDGDAWTGAPARRTASAC